MAPALQAVYVGERTRQRALGAFYTPASIADLLVQWSLAGKACRLLDPSFGGCAFLDAAARHLKALGVKQPARLLCGVDIDSDCAKYVEANPFLKGATIYAKDFLAVQPGNALGFFEAIAGNPPFVRHHFMSTEQRDSARSAAAAGGVSLPSTSSLWAYFVVHSTRFLKPNGRLALVLPEAVLQAQYAAPVRRFLIRRFRHIRWIRLKERVFAGTDEAVTLLFAWGQGPGEEGEESVDRASAVAELSALVKSLSSRSVGDVEAEKALEDVLTSPSVLSLGEIAEIKIGIVTGANKFFIVTEEQARRLRLASTDRVPVLTATRHLRGLEFSDQDAKELGGTGIPSQLVRLQADSRVSPPLRQWIDDGAHQGIHQRHHCRIRRGAWYRVATPDPPDAFATCCRSGSPLLVLNQARWQTTNTLHAVRFRPGIDPHVVALGALTTIASLAAELQGRRYGGGVLKMEPGSWQRLPIPLSSRATRVFAEANRLIRGGCEEQARLMADQVVLVDGLGLTPSTVKELRQMVSRLAAWRRPFRRRE